MTDDLATLGMIDYDEIYREKSIRDNSNSPVLVTPVRRRRYPIKQWEQVETIVYPFDTYDGQKLACFESLRDNGVPCNVLLSLASLIAKHKGTLLVSAISCARSNNDTRTRYMVVGSFLIGSSDQILKLECVRLLMMELLPPVGRIKEEDDSAVQGTLDYILGHDFGWNLPVHSQLPLFVRLRETCAYLKQEQIQSELFKRETVARVVRGGDVAADVISGAALAVETGLSWSVPVLTGSIDTAGNLIKHVITPTSSEEVPKTKAAVVASTYTDAAKRATDGVRVGTRAAVHGIRDVSTLGITSLANEFEEERLGEKLVPDKDQRDVLVAAGKVGVASLGAVAIVGEAMFNTTSAVLKKTAYVTADVVRHKYGDSAGQIVQDASDTTGNVLRTVAHVAMLEGKVLTKSVAKNTSKAKIRQGDMGPTMKQLENPKVVLTKMVAKSTEKVQMIRQGDKIPTKKQVENSTVVSTTVVAKSDGKIHIRQCEKTRTAKQLDDSAVVLTKTVASECSFASSSKHDRIEEKRQTDKGQVLAQRVKVRL